MIFLHQRIKIQPLPLFFYLQPSAFFYLHTITNHKITDPRITRNNFFYGKINYRSQRRGRGLPGAGSAATALAGAGPRRHIWPHAACARSRGVPSAEHGRVAPRALDLEQQLHLVRRRLGGLWGRAGQQAAAGKQREQQAGEAWAWCLHARRL